MRADTKTHQQHRITLDDETVEVLRAYIERVDTQARRLRVKLPPTAFLFTSAPDGSEPLVPNTATQRYVPTLLALHRNDVALISFGDFPMASALQPPLTVVDQDAYAFGRQPEG